jgi:adenosylcobinamide-phosphate synthase
MLFNEHAVLVLLCAMALDGLVGDPDWLWRRLPHPITLMGRFIAILDRTLNLEAAAPLLRRLLGTASLVLLVAMAAALGIALQWLLGHSFGFALVEVVIVAILLAQRSLFEHVDRVRLAFLRGGLTEARSAVAMIVGRNPEVLDEAAVCRASIESTAENFSDGVVAPAFWYLVGGLPGILAYKMINTADSMIGHRTARHEAFGWAAARVDDVANLLPARLAGLLIVMAALATGMSWRDGWRAMWRDAGKHRSPNAGWPEAAMAGSLGLALAGPRVYGNMTVEDAWMNAEGSRTATPDDITRALRLLAGACLALAAVVSAILLGFAAALAFTR